jgi:hypothetical protein
MENILEEELQHYPGIWLEGLSKTTNHLSQNGLCCDQFAKMSPVEWSPEVLLFTSLAR